MQCSWSLGIRVGKTNRLFHYILDAPACTRLDSVVVAQRQPGLTTYYVFSGLSGSDLDLIASETRLGNSLVTRSVVVRTYTTSTLYSSQLQYLTLVRHGGPDASEL